MKRAIPLSLGACVFVTAFFFFAPTIPMDIIPCQHFGFGYASLSYRLFHIGEGYFPPTPSVSRGFYWLTQSYADCV